MTLEIPTEREMKAFSAPTDIPATSPGTGWEAQSVLSDRNLLGRRRVQAGAGAHQTTLGGNDRQS